MKSQITSETIQIEPLDRRHAEDMQRLVADPRVTRFTPKPDPYPPGEAAREIDKAIADRAAGSAYCFAILSDDAFAGVCKLKEVTAEQGELGYWIALPYWGRGVATRGAALILEFAFGELGLRRIVAHTLAMNPASARVLERLGFEHVITEPNTHPKWPSDELVWQFQLTQAGWLELAR